MMKRFCATFLFVVGCFYASAIEKSTTVVYIDGSKYYIHTVQKGETLYALSKTYGVGGRVIEANNAAVAAGLKAGERLRIPYTENSVEQLSDRKLRKTFDSHEVAAGETLYAISRRYAIPIQTIIADNPSLDPIRLRPGERILIRKKKRGSEDEAGAREQWEAYRQSLNSVAEEGYAYHLVESGETVYSLSRRFGIDEEELGRLNGGLKAEDLKAGAILKVPVARSESEPEPSADSPDAAEPHEETASVSVEFRPLPAGETLEVALLLPVQVQNTARSNYLEFYRGFLLGLDSVKHNCGCSAHVTLYNTGRDLETVERILESPEFEPTRLIIGPVYEEVLPPVVRFAESNDVPVVSPLAHLSDTRSDALFQMAPDPSRKYDKTADLFASDKQVTLIYTEKTDKEFEREILAQLGDRPYARHTYQYAHFSSGKNDLSPLLENSEDNVFVVMADNEIDVDRILAALASADTNITSRGRTAPRYTVLGNARWNRYNNIDRTIFFKAHVVFVSTYHAKRDARIIVDFDKAYIRAFGQLPTLYSYRGYDAAAIFVPAMFNDIQYEMEGRTFTPLQTTYRFGQESDAENHVNTEWIRVNYNTDFTITIQ